MEKVLKKKILQIEILRVISAILLYQKIFKEDITSGSMDIFLGGLSH